MCIADAHLVLPVDNTEAVTPGSSLCRSVIRSPTLISMGLRKNRHFSFLEGNGTSRTRRPYLYFKDTSATERGKEICWARIPMLCFVQRSLRQARLIGFTPAGLIVKSQTGGSHATHRNIWWLCRCSSCTLPLGGGSVLQKSAWQFPSRGSLCWTWGKSNNKRREGRKKKTLSAHSICSWCYKVHPSFGKLLSCQLTAEGKQIDGILKRRILTKRPTQKPVRQKARSFEICGFCFQSAFTLMWISSVAVELLFAPSLNGV